MTFECRICREQHPDDAQVVTRHPTGRCRACWGRSIAKGHRRGTSIPDNICKGCGERPRTQGWGLCDECKRAYRAAHRGKRARREQVLTPRETSEVGFT
jgi:hypothetical protein